MANIKSPKITPFLWYDKNALEAAKFYCKIFKNSKITGNTPMVVSFKLDGLELKAINGGPQFKFTEAVSFVVDCKTQKEVDYFWEKLSNGGSKLQCGWVKDKYGLSWQIVPSILPKLMSDKDRSKTERVMQAILKMNKIEIDKLKAAYNQK